jgi:hypothetical protein
MAHFQFAARNFWKISASVSQAAGRAANLGGHTSNMAALELLGDVVTDFQEQLSRSLAV